MTSGEGRNDLLQAALLKRHICSVWCQTHRLQVQVFKKSLALRLTSHRLSTQATATHRVQFIGDFH